MSPAVAYKLIPILSDSPADVEIDQESVGWVEIGLSTAFDI